MDVQPETRTIREPCAQARVAPACLLAQSAAYLATPDRPQSKHLAQVVKGAAASYNGS